MPKAVLPMLVSIAAVLAPVTACVRPQDAPKAASLRAAPALAAMSRIALEGEGRGDYIFADADTRRLYVTHTGRVHILDLDTLAELAQVRGLTKAQGVVPIASLGRGFVTDGKANEVVIFDLSTGATLAHVAAGKKPDSIVYDPAAQLVLAFGGTSEDATAIDPRTGQVVKTIPLGDKPEFARADGKGTVWVNLEGTGALAQIDTRTLSVTAKHVLAGCEEPSALALDTAAGLVFTTCSNGLLKVVGTGSGAIIATVPICQDADGAVFDAGRGMVSVACRDGTLTQITRDSGGHYHPRTVATELYAKTLAFDPVRGRLFSSTADLIWPGGKVDTTGEILPDAVPGSFHLLVIG